MASIIGSDSDMKAYSSATENSSSAWKYIAYLMTADSFNLDMGDDKGSNTTVSQNVTGFNITDASTLQLSDVNNTFHYLMAYHFFGLLWTAQFHQSFGIMCISGAVASWYFAGPHDG